MGLRDKIISRESLAELLPRLKAEGKKIGFTSGVFDLIHPGHVDYLEKAKLHCDLLIVAVNTDASVKSNKGELRPVCPEQDRLEVIAALGSTDYVFLFSEKNNNKNIEILKPDVYIKAGDYDKNKLSSAPLVESYGGQIQIIPLIAGRSSTNIIERISLAALSQVILPEELTSSSQPEKIIFLDRDGTINEEVSYLHEADKLVIIPGVFEGLKKLQAAGYRFVMITNQPGIGLGYFTKEDFFKVTRALFYKLSAEGIRFLKIYFCPHNDAENCNCRKPRTGMIDRALRELKVDLENSYIIGDMTSDIELGNRAGIKTILLETGAAGKDKKCQNAKPTAVIKDLNYAADYIISMVK